MELRDYQRSIYNQVVSSDTNDLVQLDTGAGKTPIIAALAKHYGRAVIVCHRNILIKQASKMLAIAGIEHAIMGARATVKICAVNNRNHVGTDFINEQSTVLLVSIDTWYSHFKRDSIEQMPGGVIIIDEAHHHAENKWGMLCDYLKCRCIGFTATPCRSDGYPLIKEFGGFFDRIVQANGYRQNGTERLISEGFLSEYRAYFCDGDAESTSKHDLNLGEPAIRTYLCRANGKQTIIIYPRVTNASQCLVFMRKHDIQAALIHGLMPQHEIQRALEAFEDKRVQVLIAVDIISEGFDMPDAEVLILARVVRSFGLYRQLCGRVLRPAPGKTALIFDLTGENISRHGLPSDPVNWNKRQGLIKRKNLTICRRCGCVFKATLTACPDCGTPTDGKPHGLGRLKLRFFDSDMIEKERKRLAAAEAERLKKEREAEAALRWCEEYLAVTVCFSDSMAGNATRRLCNELQTELKKQLKPLDYNNFFQKISDKLSQLPFYLVSGKKGTAMEIYNKNK